MEKAVSNPFNITFGEEPTTFISRDHVAKQITDSFDSENPESRIFILTGPRGCGKTVLLSKLKAAYAKREGWIAVDLNPYGPMLEQLCAKIYEQGKAKRLFLKAEFSFSFKGLTFSIHGENPVSNVDTLLEKMFTYIRKKGVRVLITVDDVSNNEEIRYFSYAFQSFIREKYNVFLLMTGLYENIADLEKEKSLTFLVRAPKVYLEGLSLTPIALSYARYLKVDRTTAVKLAKMTMGYAYGYQLLGNLLYKNGSLLNEDLLERFDLTLEDNVYSLIWKSLTKKEKTILIAVAEGNVKVGVLLQKTGLTNSAFQIYKKRLFQIGVIDASQRGQITLALPRFREFVLLRKEFED